MYRHGFTLVEVLISLAITLVITLNAATIMSLVKVNYKDHNEDIDIGIKELSNYLMTANNIQMDQDLIYEDTTKKSFTIIIDHHRLVKTPGFEILIMDIDDITYSKKNDYLYCTITRDDQTFIYLLADLYRFNKDDNNEESDEDETTPQESQRLTGHIIINQCLDAMYSCLFNLSTKHSPL